MGRKLQIFLWIILLASTAGAQLMIPALDVTNKGADTTFIRRTSVRTDSLFGHLYGTTDSLWFQGGPIILGKYLYALHSDSSMFMGVRAGNSGAYRYCNAFGYGAMDSAGGNSNLFNNAFGFEALKMSGSGAQSNGNNAFGHKALSRLSAGVDNNAFGLQTMRDMADGDNNSAYGDQSLLLAVTGDQNSAFGQSTMLNSDSSSQNTILGAEAGSYLRGNGNIGIGYQALYFNIRNNFRIAIGHQADWGAFNDSLGMDTTIAIGFKATTDSQGIAIGDSAVALLKNSGAIGNHTTARRQGYITIKNLDSDTVRATGGFIADSTTAIFKFWFKRNDTTFAVVGTDTLYWPKKP